MFSGRDRSNRGRAAGGGREREGSFESGCMMKWWRTWTRSLGGLGLAGGLRLLLLLLLAAAAAAGCVTRKNAVLTNQAVPYLEPELELVLTFFSASDLQRSNGVVVVVGGLHDERPGLGLAGGGGGQSHGWRARACGAGDVDGGLGLALGGLALGGLALGGLALGGLALGGLAVSLSLSLSLSVSFRFCFRFRFNYFSNFRVFSLFEIRN